MFDVTLAYKEIEDVLTKEYQELTEDPVPLTAEDIELVIETLDSQTLDAMEFLATLILNNAIYNMIEEIYDRRYPRGHN
jgi:NACalpha-BTF3-like transcription factor